MMISIAMHEFQVEGILKEAKNQATEVAFTLANHHLQYKDGARNRDIDAKEINEAIERLDTISGLIESLEDAKRKSKEGE